VPEAWAALLGGYLLGSIPFSFLVARLWGVADVRAVGSGNVGATNVMRAAGRLPGILALALDAGKGAASSALALALVPAEPMPALAAVGAVVGHTYPLWLGFRGGKGVATGAGALLPLAPLATAAALVAFALTLAAGRYVSIASLAGAACLALAAWLSGAPPSVWRAAAGLALLIAWKHRGNLERIARGVEPRL
jgi:glycerol-3-phosphate acyltransferase PlsY